MLKRIVFAPVCAALYIIEVLLNMITNIYIHLTSLIWKLMIITSLWAIYRHLWKQLIITVLISVLAFIGLAVFAFISGTIEDTRKWLWRIWDVVIKKQYLL